MNRPGRPSVVTAVITGALLALCGIASCDRDKPAPKPASQPATAPVPTTTTGPATQPKVARTLLDVIQANQPSFPTTEPLIIPGSLDEAARVTIRDPVYLDSRGDLWITRDDAPPTADVLQNASDEQTHVVRDRVLFARWTVDEKRASATLVIDDNGTNRLSSLKSRIDIAPDSYDWTRAFAWNERIVVPTATAIAVIDPSGKIDKAPLLSSGGPLPQALIEPGGLIAWAPWDNGKSGSKGAARYRDGKWTRLDSSNHWPDQILQLIPLRDGSVLQLIVQKDGTVKLDLDVDATVAAPSGDAAKIAALVTKLSDPDPKIRQGAFAELGQSGPSIYPVLEKLRPEQIASVQNRIDELLEAKTAPKLGTLALVPGEAVTAQRLRDGGVVLYFENGITLPRGDDDRDEQIFAPAWISLRPALSPEILSERMVSELQPGKQMLTAFMDEWIVTDDIVGPKRFLGNHYGILLKKGERRKFKEFVGVDRRARWIYRNPADGSTLLVDPTIPDPTPRLPVWQYPVREGQVGWTNTNWPAVKNVGTWVLTEDDKDWRPLDEKTEKFMTELPDVPLTVPVTTQPTVVTTTTQSTQPSTMPTSRPILVEPDGTRFFDGKRTLTMLDTTGKLITWNLPPTATGDWDYIRLFRAGDHRLFLFNQPGRVLRIQQTGNPDVPFKVEAAFARKIPNSDTPQRIWQDPAGRIIIAQEKELSILFPSGRIPPAIADKMPPSHEDEEDF